MVEKQMPLKVFLCHATQDKPKVRKLYQYLREHGIQPWLDVENLLPGQSWRLEIPKALNTSDAIIICLSKNSIDKEGYVQKEIKFALEKALEIPEGRIFLIPARLEECDVPQSLENYQWVDLFEENGYSRLIKSLNMRSEQLAKGMAISKETNEVNKPFLGKSKTDENISFEKLLPVQGDQNKPRVVNNKILGNSDYSSNLQTKRKAKNSKQEIITSVPLRKKGVQDNKNILSKTIKDGDFSNSGTKKINITAKSSTSVSFSGAIIGLIFFFLPWVLASCNSGESYTPYTGFEVSIDASIYSPVLLLIPLICVVLFFRIINFWIKQKAEMQLGLFLVDSGVLMLVTLLSHLPWVIFGVLDSVKLKPAYGLWGSLAGIIAVIIGGIFLLSSQEFWQRTDKAKYLKRRIVIFPILFIVFALVIYFSDDISDFSPRSAFRGFVSNFYESAPWFSNPIPTPVIRGMTPIPKTDIIDFSNVSQLIPIARWGKGKANDVQYSSDGHILVVASDIGIYLYDAKTLEEIRHIETNSLVLCIAFSPDGNFIAAGFEDKKIKIFQVSDLLLTRTMSGHSGPVISIAFSPDGTLLASGSEDEKIKLWNVNDGSIDATLRGHTSYVDALSFSPNGKILASIAFRTIKFWQMPEGKLIRSQELDEEVYDIAFSPDGTLLASSGYGSDGEIKLWRVLDGTLFQTFNARSVLIPSVTFSSDGTVLVSGSSDGEIDFWAVSTGNILQTIKMPGEGIGGAWAEGVMLSPDGKIVVSRSQVGTIQIWKISDGSFLSNIIKHTGTVESIDFSPDSSLIVAGMEDSTIRLWRVSDGKLLTVLSGHQEQVSGITFSPDGLLLASISVDGKINIWILEDGTLFQTINPPDGFFGSGFWCIAFSPDGTILASCQGSVINLWEVSDGLLIRTLNREQNGEVWSIAFSPDGNLLASGSLSESNNIGLWRVGDGVFLGNLSGHTSWVRDVTFSPDGTLLASGGEDNKIVLSHIPDGTIVQTMIGFSIGLAFSPSGNLLISNDYNDWGGFGVLNVWQIPNGNLLSSISTDANRDVAFSPDGKLIAAGLHNGTIQIWGIKP